MEKAYREQIFANNMLCTPECVCQIIREPVAMETMKTKAVHNNRFSTSRQRFDRGLVGHVVTTHFQ